MIDTNDYIPKVYGISQNPNTKDYIIVCQDVYYSGNKIVDNFIQEMHLKISFYKDTIFEWIPYNKFNNIKEISKGDYAIICSAMWKDGLLYYDRYNDEKYTRKSDKNVVLKYLYNSQNIINEYLDEV